MTHPTNPKSPTGKANKPGGWNHHITGAAFVNSPSEKAPESIMIQCLRRFYNSVVFSAVVPESALSLSRPDLELYPSILYNN